MNTNFEFILAKSIRLSIPEEYIIVDTRINMSDSVIYAYCRNTVNKKNNKIFKLSDFKGYDEDGTLYDSKDYNLHDIINKPYNTWITTDVSNDNTISRYICDELI